mmetsp:Transcript_2662/g.3620  ORF Transcript_2662/g.3620 Transcript_2662/m.3620 type:complete len:318 (+) Transcript_2662:338-1291(+)
MCRRREGERGRGLDFLAIISMEIIRTETPGQPPGTRPGAARPSGSSRGPGRGAGRASSVRGQHQRVQVFGQVRVRAGRGPVGGGAGALGRAHREHPPLQPAQRPAVAVHLLPVRVLQPHDGRRGDQVHRPLQPFTYLPVPVDAREAGQRPQRALVHRRQRALLVADHLVLDAQPRQRARPGGHRRPGRVPAQGAVQQHVQLVVPHHRVAEPGEVAPRAVRPGAHLHEAGAVLAGQPHHLRVAGPVLHAQRSQHLGHVGGQRSLLAAVRALKQVVVQVHERAAVQGDLVVLPEGHHLVLALARNGVHHVLLPNQKLLH